MSNPTIRTHVELTQEQGEALRALCGPEPVPLSELVRRGIDRLLGPVERTTADRLEKRRRRELAVVGRFASGRRDGSERHDKLAADAFGS